MLHHGEGALAIIAKGDTSPYVLLDALAAACGRRSKLGPRPKVSRLRPGLQASALALGGCVTLQSVFDGDHDERHDRDVVLHAVELQRAVKLLWDTRRELNPHLIPLNPPILARKAHIASPSRKIGGRSLGDLTRDWACPGPRVLAVRSLHADNRSSSRPQGLPRSVRCPALSAESTSCRR